MERTSGLQGDVVEKSKHGTGGDGGGGGGGKDPSDPSILMTYISSRASPTMSRRSRGHAVDSVIDQRCGGTKVGSQLGWGSL